MQPERIAQSQTPPSAWSVLDTAGRLGELIPPALGGAVIGFVFWDSPGRPDGPDRLAWLLLALAVVGLGLATWDWRRFLMPGVLAAVVLVPSGVRAAGAGWPGGAGVGLVGGALGVAAACLGTWWKLSRQPPPAAANPPAPRGENRADQ